MAISLLVIATSLATVLFARGDPVPPPVDYYGVRGYQGNSVIYLNTGVVGTMPISVISDLPTVTGSQPRAPEYDNINNVVNLIVGSGHSTSSGNKQFQETFMGAGSNYLYVVIPVTSLGATRKWWSVARPSEPAMVYDTFLGVSVANGDVSPPEGHFQVQVNTDTLYDSGVNVTGANHRGDGSKNWQALASLALDVGCYIIPGYDFACLVVSQMLNMYGLISGVDYGPTDFLGNGNSFLQYYVTGGGDPVNTPDAPFGEAKDVFAADMLLYVQIPYDTTTNQFPFTPTFTFGATNWVEDPNWYYDGYTSLVIGANASATLNSFPAVLLTGTVCRDAQSTAGSCQDAQPLANQPIVLTTWVANQQINYHLTTDSQGKYSFFAPLSTGPYQIYTTYSSPFGTTTAYSPWFSTDANPDTQTINLQLPTIYGQVISSGSNSPIPGATIKITSPGGAAYSTTTDSNGNYVVTVGPQGTYSVKAMAYGYQYATSSVPVNANSGFLTNFGLVAATPDFTATSCGGVTVYTYSSGTCRITISSNAGWQGTVTVTTTQPSGSGAPTITSVTSPVTVPQFGTVTSTVGFSSSSATGTWTVTVTVTSQDGSIIRTTTFTITVQNPPPPPGCPPVCKT